MTDDRLRRSCVSAFGGQAMTNGFHPKADKKQAKPASREKSASSAAQPPGKKADVKSQSRKKE